MHVKLTRDYPIRGDRCRKGQVVEVIESTAQWMIGNGIAVAVDVESESDNGNSESDTRHDQIVAVIRDLIDSDPEKADETLWTKSGKPDVKALEALLGFDISAAERDAAMAKVISE